MKNILYILFLFSISVSATEYYVTTAGSGTTCSVGSPCDIEYAIETKAVAGDTVWIKAGLYSDYIITQTNNGTSPSPIYIIGYKTTTGDLDEDAQTTKTEGSMTINVTNSFAYGDSVDSAEMPLLQEARSGVVGVGKALNIAGDYVHVYNLQFQYYDQHLWVAGDNCVIKNIIGDECGGFATAGQSDGQSIRISGDNNTVKNIYSQNSGGITFTIKGNNNTIDAVTAVSDNTTNPSDYYYLHQQTATPMTGNVSTNIYVLRVGNIPHYGHGIVFKSSAVGDTDLNTITDFIIDNTTLELQFPGTHDNTFTNGYIVQRSNTWTDNGGGITIANGSYSCTLNNIYLKDAYIRFADWDDGLGGDVSNVAGSAGHDFIFNQITVDARERGLVYARPLVRFNYFSSDNLDGSAEDNTFYNCTFYDGGRLFERSRDNVNTQFINCIFDTANGESSFSSGPGYTLDVSYSSVNFNDVGFAPIPTGTNITSVNPGFIDATNGDFEVTHASLLGQGIVTPFLAVGNDIGSFQSAGATAVTGVGTYPTSDKMLVAGTRQLTEIVAPAGATDKTGTWATTNGAVATVVDGLVTAQGVGSCTITWTANDTTNGTIDDTTTITVESSSTEDSILVLGPHGYYDGTSGDADSWDDISGYDLHGVENGTITFTDEASFDGSSWYSIIDPNGFMNYLPGTDSFTLIWREGDTSPTTSGYAISKADATPKQYGATYSTGNFQSIYLGTAVEGTVSAPDTNPNRLFIAVISPTEYSVWTDGVPVITSSSAIGADISTSNINIGGRTDGGYLFNNGATLDLVATIPKAISAGERAAIESEFRVNLDPVTDLSTRPAAANGTPVFYNNGRKILNPN